VTNSKSNFADPAPNPDAAANGEFMTKKQIKALMEETKRTSALGAKHQISALTQQVQNLREQLNQALTQVQHCEKQHRRSVGA
jgi:enterochelin esterase-like enzyme